MVVYNALIAISAFMAIAFESIGTLWLFAIFKPLTTILIIWALVSHRQIFTKSTYRVFVAALVACLAGDVFLLDDAYFVAGLSAFLIGHLLFVRLFVSLGGWSWNPMLLIVLISLGGFYFWYIEPSLGELKLPVGIYSSVIVLMAWQGVGLAVKSNAPRSSLIAIGALLFMFSDSMIAFNKFVEPFDLSAAAILSTYWLSLTLVLNAVISMVRFSHKSD